MSATDELRRLLDERRAHWWAGEDERKTLWESNGLTWEFFDYENGNAWLGFLGACEQDITPEQAITATLGGVRTERTCKFVSSRGSDCPPVCSACGYELDLYECLWFEDGTYGYGGNYCSNCGAKVVSE